jgi:hypothetical protein
MIASTDLPTAAAVPTHIISLWQAAQNQRVSLGVLGSDSCGLRFARAGAAAGRYSIACDTNRRLEFLSTFDRVAYE